MAEMEAICGDRELRWTDGVWSGDPEAVRLANLVVATWGTVEIIPLPDLPVTDDSSEVVGYIMTWVLGALPGDAGVEITHAEGMKSRTAHWDAYNADGRVY